MEPSVAKIFNFYEICDLGASSMPARATAGNLYIHNTFAKKNISKKSLEELKRNEMFYQII